MTTTKKALTVIEERQPEYDEAVDPDYGDEGQPDFDAGADPDYNDDFRDPDAEDGSQEWRARPQK